MNTFDKYIENNKTPLFPDDMVYVVTGDNISKKQAKDIIIKTNYSSKHVEMLKNYTEISNSELFKELELDIKENVLNRMGSLSLNTLRNDWIESHYYGGVNGFCRPDGTIGNVYRKSEQSSLLELSEDMEILGKEFPYLHLEVFVFNKEKGNNDITLKVTLNNSKVEINKYRFTEKDEKLIIKIIKEENNLSVNYGNKNPYFTDVKEHLFLKERYGMDNDFYEMYFNKLKEIVEYTIKNNNKIKI